ncbi:ATP-grasp domain-containing protein [Desulforhopalus singaporensis]|uniref:Ribosomal protein S6--L-glutamate ligase n=1 Tax=Desulforhopalus singaporensis TaxID=91360 RepID=A0A1H0K3Y6_9BACT|nr:hypothetical protein [Desulforhopalus singaporensis]SDO50472.1 ribosomal protein S6--L-glutamate ligase [Desulforhopalus singaporensis]
MKECPVIIRDNGTFQENFCQLTRDDIVCGRIRLRYGEETILTRLTELGVRFIPSAACQLASRSKVLQARIFKKFLPEHTTAVYNRHDLLSTISLFNKHGIGRVVLKQDCKDGGLGVHLFEDIESLYNRASFDRFDYPFVVQPFIDHSRDVRVIILGEYLEAYERINNHNFRRNLHCGGSASSFVLNNEQLAFCRSVLAHGGFPYGHLDLLITKDSTRMMEINLRGGLRGARLTGKEYEHKIDQIHERMLQQHLADMNTAIK